MISKKLLIFLSSWIIENTEFNSSENCRVKAYYVKDSGIFYIDKMQPEKDICDKSIILHEMVHHYQKNDDRVIELDERTLWTLQERQAIYYQNLFLISQKRLNDNQGPENVLQCEGGSYLDLQYKFNESR